MTQNDPAAAPACPDCVERSRWRKVADELPPKSALVLVYFASGVVGLAYYHTLSWPSGKRIASWVSTDAITGISYGCEGRPTHWRPLPAPPKEGEL